MSLEINPRELCWRQQDAFTKQIEFKYTGTSDIWIEVLGTPQVSNSEFYWGAIPRTLMQPDVMIRLSVRPPVPANNPGTKTAAIPFTVTGTINGHVIQTGSINCRNDCQSKVIYGDLQITALMSDPPGSDVAPEGEYIDLLNVTSMELDLAGCYITQQVFNASSTPTERSFVRFPSMGEFNVNDFGKTSRLTSGARLRILTRMKNNADPTHDPLRYYAAMGRPVWNNTGDRAMIYNAENDLIVRYGYGSQANIAGTPNTTPMPPAPTQPVRRLIHDFSVDINPTFGFVPVIAIEDGDEIELTTEETSLADNFIQSDIIGVGVVGNAPFSPEYLPSGSPLHILPRRIGAIAAAPEGGWPLPGVAKYSLIGAFDENGTNAFAIGSGHTLTVTLSQPKMLHLGINDDVLWDNRGIFRVFVRIFRR